MVIEIKVKQFHLQPAAFKPMPFHIVGYTYAMMCLLCEVYV
jgi:hypothetical protein